MQTAFPFTVSDIDDSAENGFTISLAPALVANPVANPVIPNPITLEAGVISLSVPPVIVSDTLPNDDNGNPIQIGSPVTVTVEFTAPTAVKQTASANDTAAQ